MARGAFAPIPTTVDADPAKAELGRALFHDRSLSAGGAVSCGDCHDVRHNGADRGPVSEVRDGLPTARNAPSVFNTALHGLQNWDASARTLRQFLDGPVNNAEELAVGWPDLVRRVATDPAYGRRFQSVFGRPPDRMAIEDALIEYIKTLTFPGAPFDRYLAGETEALTPRQKQGLSLFINLGCVSCHQGVNLGANIAQRLGVVKPVDWRFGDDTGLAAVTGDPADTYVFKVPSLRNVAVTAPYLHDGSLPSLDAVVELMGAAQLGVELTGREVGLITDFLDSLTAPGVSPIPPGPGGQGGPKDVGP